METRLTIAQVARLVGKTRRSVDLWIKNGKLSTVISEGGKKLVEVSELLRICPEIRGEMIEKELSQTSQNVREDSSPEARNSEKKHADYELEILRREVDFQKEQISFLEKRLEEVLTEKRNQEEERATLLAQQAQTLQLLERLICQKQLPARTSSASNRARDSLGRFVRTSHTEEGSGEPR